MTDPLPFCDKCNKTVDMITRDQSPDGSSIFFTVYCHGEEEMTEISRHDMIRFEGMEPGVAFRRMEALET